MISSASGEVAADAHPDPRQLGPQVPPHHDLDQLHELDTALNRWQRWANGQRITVAELDDSVIVLEDAGTSPGAAAYQALALAARSWADEHGIDLSPPNRQLDHHAARPPVSMEIDL